MKSPVRSCIRTILQLRLTVRGRPQPFQHVGLLLRLLWELRPPALNYLRKGSRLLESRCLSKFLQYAAGALPGPNWDYHHHSRIAV
jgi:hypothetical protein